MRNIDMLPVQITNAIYEVEISAEARVGLDGEPHLRRVADAKLVAMREELARAILDWHGVR